MERFNEQYFSELGSHYDQIQALVVSERFNIVLRAWLDIYCRKIHNSLTCMNHLGKFFYIWPQLFINPSEQKLVWHFIELVNWHVEDRFLPIELCKFVSIFRNDESVLRLVGDHLLNRFVAPSFSYPSNSNTLPFETGCSLILNVICNRIHVPLDVLNCIYNFARPVPYDYVFNDKYLTEYHEGMLVGPDSRIWTIDASQIIQLPSEIAFQALKADRRPSWPNLRKEYFTFNNEFFRLRTSVNRGCETFILTENGFDIFMEESTTRWRPFCDHLIKYDWKTQKFDITTPSKNISFKLPFGFIDRERSSSFLAAHNGLYIIGCNQSQYYISEVLFSCDDQLIRYPEACERSFSAVKVNKVDKFYEHKMSCNFDGGIIVSTDQRIVNIETPLNQKAFQYHWTNSPSYLYVGGIFPYCEQSGTFITIVNDSIWGIVPRGTQFTQ